MDYNESLEKIKEKYTLTEQQYNEMYEKCKQISFYKCTPSEHPIAVFTGGQTGSGKGGIDVYSVKEVRKNGEHMAVLDVDVYRATYPYTNEILNKYPTMYADITAEVTGKIVNRIIDEAIENRYNFVFEGTLRNMQPFETLKSMPDCFQKYIRVMAVSNIESLLTAFERNYEQIKLSGYGRFTNIETHNKTYNGVLNTIKAIENSEHNNIFIEVFKRGNHMVSPIKIFSEKDETGKLASQVIIDERNKDREMFKNERKNRLKYLLDTLEPKDEYEKIQLGNLKEELSFLL